jgi:hypothetical protein
MLLAEGDLKKFNPLIDEKTPDQNTEAWRNHIVSEREKTEDVLTPITLYVPPSTSDAQTENEEFLKLQNFMLFG